MKRFNTTGSCNPERHYMVDAEKCFKAVESMINAGEYFTINRARQYGKTTTLNMIRRKLSDRYLIIQTSFEGVGDNPFKTELSFVQMFASLVGDVLQHQKKDENLLSFWNPEKIHDFKELGITISQFCKVYHQPVVILIDEVDKSSDNQTFVGFIGLLRDLYLKRDQYGIDSTFHSVILAGVYDIKNLKLKLRPDAEKKYNSPWNIAADFNVDMTFHPEEIAKMLQDYENEHHIGMDVKKIGEEIYKYTTGYPYLVSAICKLIDEQLDRDWTEKGVVKAVKIIVQGNNTLMDDLSKNLENYPEFREFMFSVAVNGISYAFTLLNPMVSMGNMFSYIKNKDGRVTIHNLVFEEALFLYFTVDYAIKNHDKMAPFQSTYIQNGRLNMEYVVERFAQLMHEEYRESTESFLEKEGRLLFLTFLKPIINGIGFYYVEPQTRDNRRMDLVVNYDRQEFIVELKIWRGDKYEQTGREQLSEYLAIRGMDEGYLLTFDFSKNKQDVVPQWIKMNGKRIFEAVV